MADDIFRKLTSRAEELKRTEKDVNDAINGIADKYSQIVSALRDWRRLSFIRKDGRVVVETQCEGQFPEHELDVDTPLPKLSRAFQEKQKWHDALHMVRTVLETASQEDRDLLKRTHPELIQLLDTKSRP